MDQLHEGISVMNVTAIKPADVNAGDRVDGYRLTGVRINRGRAWRKWNVPAAVLRLDRRSFK